MKEVRYWSKIFQPFNHMLPLDSQIGATESRSSATRVISDDSFNRGVESGTKHKQPTKQYKDVSNRINGPEQAIKIPSPVKLPICDRKEDETEEGVEGGAKKGEEIPHARNDFREDESDSPDTGHNQSPNTPSDDRVTVCVPRVAHYSEVDELCTDVRVDDANDEGRNDNESERTFLIGFHTQTTESWRCGVLAQVSKSNRWGNNKQEDRNCNKDSQGFGKVLRSFHLGYKGGEEDLRNPEKSDVQNSVHAIYPGRTRKRESIGLN